MTQPHRGTANRAAPLCSFIALPRPLPPFDRHTHSLPTRSFRDPVRYDLANRGLVVVTGQVHDTAEAGKSSMHRRWLGTSMYADVAGTGAAGSRCRTSGGCAASKAGMGARRCTLHHVWTCLFPSHPFLSTFSAPKYRPQPACLSNCAPAHPSPDPCRPTPSGVESNGAGKTALMMAPLWALTGSVDARAEVGPPPVYLPKHPVRQPS